jgi:adenylate cyclase
MAIEIERKFLLSGDGWRRQVTSSSFLRQGYLGGDGVSVRVRIDDDMANLNIKSRTPGIARSEFEYAIPLADAHALLVLVEGPILEKVRHRVEYAGHVWEIDEFGGDNAGLVVAEIELDRVDEPFERPDWIGLEVTDDIRYYNLNLSREPYSRWSEC